MGARQPSAHRLRRYPVDADASDLVAARTDVERYAEDNCAEGWRVPESPT